MKHLILLGLITISFLSAHAQSNKEDVDMIQAIYGKEKKDIVAAFIMPPADAKKTVFWNLYDSYETERKALGQKRVTLLEEYVDAYDSLDDKTTDNIMKQTMELQKSMDGLIGTYYDKIKKSVGVKQAAQFYHIESYLLSATRIYILGNMPFIDNLEKMPTTPEPGK
jgi:hypothetical protein